MFMRQSLYQKCDGLRMIDEEKKPRPFSEDLQRVLASEHFRVLSGKTQMIPDAKIYHNRFTHSLDVCSLSGIIAKKVNEDLQKAEIQPVNDDLLKAASLAHDIGHPPFGHTGERTLDKVMAKRGGFESNAQSVKILVESPFNVTYRTLGSLLKHTKSIPTVREDYMGLVKGYYGYMSSTLHPIFSVYQRGVLEQSIVDMADTLSYLVSDMKDLIAFCGKHHFSQKVHGYLTDMEVLDDASLSFNHVSTGELQYVIGKAGTEIMDNLLIPLLSTNEKKRLNHHSFIQSIIRNLTVEIDPIKPMYSRLNIPLEDHLKIFILTQLTRKCFLETDISMAIDRKIDDVVKRAFDYLFHCSDEVSLVPLDHAVMENLANMSDEAEKARTVCDLICRLTDDQLVHLTSKLNKKIIVV
ncbi:dNTP triphosphohydrolase [Bacillus sp. RO3]|nr:dNTP triphosphohydrolase [Bacillus sp. RO3]